MSHCPVPGYGESAIYQIRLRGQLGPEWADWFAGMEITVEANGDTVLSGLVADQAALHGLLRTVCDLAIPLISVNRVDCGA